MGSEPIPINVGAGYYLQPTIQTTGTTNVYYGTQGLAPSPAPLSEPEPGPLDWLRDQVGEICELAVA